MADADETRRSYQRGRQDELTEIISIVLRAIHACRLLKQNTSQLEEVLSAFKARRNLPTPTPSSAEIPIIRITLDKK